MPYFVYQITPPLKLTCIDTHERYADARGQVRGLRQTAAEQADTQFRLIFARTQGEAERLLSTPRDTRVIGED